MLNGLYSAATAMDAATREHEIIAQNLAHAQMPGYRRQSVRHGSFESHFDSELHDAVYRQSFGASAQQIVSDFAPGAMEHTGRSLDVALQGDGFFVIETAQGQLYTRNGAFTLDDSGRLVTADGQPVVGVNGPITAPSEITASQIEIALDGTVRAGDIPLGQLKVVRFEQPQKLQRVGVTVFAAPEGVEPQESTARVQQGSREKSNVSPVQELVLMIAAQRRHEAAQRSMSQINEAVQRHIDLRGGV